MMMMMMMMTKMMMKMIIFFYRLCCGEEAKGRRYVEQSQWLPLHWSPLHGHQPSREFGVGVPCNGCQCSRKQWTQLVLTIIQNQRENWCVVIQFKVSISCILIILILFFVIWNVFLFLTVGSAPEFIKKPADTKAPLGGEVSFTAEVHGNPFPTCQWWAKNKSLKELNQGNL